MEGVTLKGRKLSGAIPYYGCEACPTPLDLGLLILTGFEGLPSNFLIMDDGVMFFFREQQTGNIEQRGIRLLRETGRVPCPDSRHSAGGDHVFCDWEFLS